MAGEQEFIDTTQPEPLRKVRPVPGFDEYAPEAAFGGGKSNRAEEGVMMDAAELMKKHETEADDARTKQDFASAAEAMNKILYDPQTGAMLRKGKDSFDIDNSENSPMIQLRGKFNELIAGAANERQANMLRGMFSKLDEEAYDQMTKHAAEESEKMAIQSEYQVNDAATSLAMNNPAKADFYRNIIRGNSQHIDGEKEIEKFNYKLGMSMLNNGDIEGAKKLVPELSTANAATLGKAVKRESAEKQGQDLFDQYGKDAIDHVKDIQDPEDRTAATKTVQSLMKAAEGKQKFATEQSYVNLVNFARSHPGVDPKKTDVTGWDNLTDVQRKNITDIAYGVNQPDAEVTGRWTHISQDENALRKMSPYEFYNDYYPHLPKDEQGEASKLYDKLHPKSGLPGKYGGKDDVLAKKQMLINSLVGSGLIRPNVKSSNDLNTSEAKVLGQLSERVMRDAEDFTAINGKNPSQSDMQDMIDGEVKRHVEGKGWGGMFKNKKSYFQMGINDIPTEQAEKIKKHFPAFSDEQVVRWYQAYINKDDKAAKAIEEER